MSNRSWEKVVTGLVAMLAFAPPVLGQAGVTSAVQGTLKAFGNQGLVVQPSTGSAGGEVNMMANRQTQVRLNYLAKTDQLQPGTYVQMRVSWDGKGLLRASSIELPDGGQRMFGLYKG